MLHVVNDIAPPKLTASFAQLAFVSIQLQHIQPQRLPLRPAVKRRFPAFGNQTDKLLQTQRAYHPATLSRKRTSSGSTRRKEPSGNSTKAQVFRRMSALQSDGYISRSRKSLYSCSIFAWSKNMLTCSSARSSSTNRWKRQYAPATTQGRSPLRLSLNFTFTPPLVSMFSPFAVPLGLATSAQTKQKSLNRHVLLLQFMLAQALGRRLKSIFTMDSVLQRLQYTGRLWAVVSGSSRSTLCFPQAGQINHPSLTCIVSFLF